MTAKIPGMGDLFGMRDLNKPPPPRDRDDPRYDPRQLELPAPPDYPTGVPPEVCELFEQLALRVRRSGYERYSARAILHRIRWHFRIERGIRDWKCNNNWTPSMARWAMARHPVELENFFELRRSPHAANDHEEDDA